MVDRRHYDTPAILLASGAGILLLVASIPFLPSLYCESPAASCNVAPQGTAKTFDILWSEAAAGTAGGRLDGAPAASSVSEPVDGLTSTATLHFSSCADTYNPQVAQPAKISWTLAIANQTGPHALAGGSFQCSEVPQSGLEVALPRLGHPDVAQIAAANATAAAAAARFGAMPEQGTYFLNVTSARPRGTLPPVPVGLPGDPTLSVQFRLELRAWQDQATPHPAGVAK